tara:strand:- start:2476 stop:2886 length:411 start_codon:yes stop_codon:yes gene_type:complete
MTYLPLTQLDTDAESLAYAQALSVAIWGLCKHPTSETTNIYRVAQHPTTGQCALVMDDQAFFVQPDANPAPLLSLVSPVLTQQQIDVLENDIIAARGNSVAVSSLLPQTVRDNALTIEQATQGGWITEQATQGGWI